jgi:endonuclease G, mitochondrial
MARNNGNRALLILFAGLILVILLITTISQTGIAPVITLLTERLGEAAEEVGEAVKTGAGRLSSRPLAEGISGYLKNSEVLAVPSGKAFEILEREGFFLAWDSDLRIALWVGYELTLEEVDGELPRLDNFRRDAELGDDSPGAGTYSGSGYDRGHLVPAADVKWSDKAMADSFLMSNVTPQLPALNRGPWRELEEAVRDLARREGAVIVITGPIIADREYPRLPEAGTVIPDYYFKVILDYSEPGLAAWGYILPNSETALAGREYDDFLFSVDEVEEFSGFDFFAPLPDELEDRLERRSPSSF